MDDMRELLRRNLGRSLEAHPALDRLRAAWPVACGRNMAAQGTLISLEAGMLAIEVESEAWLEELRSRGQVLQHELARISRVPLTGIHFRKAVGAR